MRIRASGADARSYNGKAFSQRFPDHLSFARRSYNSLATGTLGQRRHAQSLVGNTPGDADLLQIVIIQAGQDRDGQNVHSAIRRFRGSAQHGRAAARVNGEHIRSQFYSGFHGMADRVRDVMQLQIEEDAPAGTNQLPYQFRAFGGEELQSYFVNAGSIGNALDKRLRGSGVRNIQGNNKPVPHPSGCGRDESFWKMASHTSQYTPIRLLCAVTLIQSYAFRLNQVNPDPLHAVAEVEHSGGAIAQVHDAVAHVGAAIIDPDDDPLAVLEVGHLDEGPQRELPVGCREFEHIEVLTAGRGSAVKLLSIPGSISNLVGFGFSLGRFVHGFGCFRGHGGGIGFSSGLLVVWNWSRPHVGSQT